jgi:putative sterol carrier protein
MPAFPSEDWVQAWVALANRSPEFEASGKGREGAVALVIEADAVAGVVTPVYVRLEARDGRLVGYDYGTHAAAAEGAIFVLRAPYRRWKQIVRQELNPVKGLVQGKIGIDGHLPVILTWAKSILVLAELAGRVQTDFVDEAKTQADGT